MKQCIVNHAVVMCALMIFSPLPGATQPATRSQHKVADAVVVELSNDWRTATRTQVSDFEKDRKEIYSRAGLEPKVKARDTVTFQAEKSEGSDSIALGITVMPGEASQAEVAALSETRIQQLGAVFAQQFRSIAASSGARDVAFTRPALQRIGDKLAISYSISFTTPDGVRRTGVKHHIYMRNATVVMSATGADSIRQSLRDDANAAIQGTRLLER